jgi:hypothetical protein
MLISLVSFTSLPDEEVTRAVRAVNRQIAEDFAPHWHLHARLRLEGRADRRPVAQRPSELRGDAILYLWDHADVPGALGYHAENAAGLPFGFVFTEVAARIGEPWSVTLSHEALELIADANVNKLAAGPHPADPGRTVFYWYEMCDAVQAEQYDLDGVTVSNFLLPLYFTPEEQPGSRNDFLGRLRGGRPLRSFGIAPGGYVGFFDPATATHETFTRTGDEEAQRRLELKAAFGGGRRSRRGDRDELLPARARRARLRVTDPGYTRVTG